MLASYDGANHIHCSRLLICGTVRGMFDQHNCASSDADETISFTAINLENNDSVMFGVQVPSFASITFDVLTNLEMYDVFVTSTSVRGICSDPRYLKRDSASMVTPDYTSAMSDESLLKFLVEMYSLIVSILIIQRN